MRQSEGRAMGDERDGENGQQGQEGRDGRDVGSGRWSSRGDLRTKTAEHGALAALRWALTRRPHRWPRSVAQPVTTELADWERDDGAIRWLLVGHSTVLLRLSGRTILLDPIWSPRCSPLRQVGPRRVRPPALAFDALPRVDIVCVSHDHYDHCDHDTLVRLHRRHSPLFVTGRGVGDHLRRWGIDRVHELDWWQCWQDDRREQGPEITFVPSRHFSARGLTDRNRTAWGGFWLRSADAGGAGADGIAAKDVYFCGDTGWDDDLFPLLRRRLGRPDLAFLPIGAYDPRWFMAAVHVDPEEAVAIHRALGARRSVAIHHATFRLTDEPIDEPARRLEACLRRHGIDGADFEAAPFGVPRHL